MAKVDLYPDFRDFLKLLNSQNVKYLIVGGYAVIYYGYSRVTDDLDVWIEVDTENAKRVSSVLREFGGFPKKDVSPKLFEASDSMFILGVPPVRIDILTSVSGLMFDQAYRKRKIVVMDGVKVPLIDIEDLIVNKTKSARYKDLADLEYLPPHHPARKPKTRRKPRS